MKLIVERCGVCEGWKVTVGSEKWSESCRGQVELVFMAGQVFKFNYRSAGRLFVPWRNGQRAGQVSLIIGRIISVGSQGE